MSKRRYRSDTQVLWLTGAAVVVAAGLLLLLLFSVTGKGAPKKTVPFTAGRASQIKSDLKDQGPYFFPDPFGHQRGFWFALENGEVVALQQHIPSDPNCTVKWKRTQFVDCHGNKVSTDSLARYRTTVVRSGQNEGALQVDLTKIDPPPAG